MNSIEIQTASAAALPPLSESGGSFAGPRRIFRANEFLVETLLPLPAATPNGTLDIRA